MIGPYQLNQFVLGDTNELIHDIPDESISLIITSPPYNMLYSTGAGVKRSVRGGAWTAPAIGDGYEVHDDNMGMPEYIKWQHDLLRIWWRKLTPDGAIFYNHKQRVFNGEMCSPLNVPSYIGEQWIPDEVIVRQLIFWERPGGFNHIPTAYTSWDEWILLLAKPDFKLVRKGAASTVWKMKFALGNSHPAPFPNQLPANVLDSAYTGGVVLDPFMGSGTTAVECQRRGIPWLGFENSVKYIEQAKARMKSIQVYPSWLK